MNKKHLILWIPVILLFLAVLSDWPYAFFQILRWVVCIGAGYCAYLAYKNEHQGWMFVLGGLAILFNPIAPIFLDRETWVPIDIISGIVMAVFLIRQKN